MTEGGRLKTFRRSDNERAGMAVAGAYSKRITAAQAFGLVNGPAATGEYSLTDLGEQAATLGAEYAAEIFETAPRPRAYQEIAGLDVAAAKARLADLGLADWKAAGILGAYASDTGAPRISAAPKSPEKARSGPWYLKEKAGELSARPWFALRACLDEAAEIWKEGSSALLSRAEAIRQASRDRTVGYRTVIAMLEYGILVEDGDGYLALAPDASTARAAELAARPPVFRAVLHKFGEAPDSERGLASVASAITAAGFSVSSSRRTARAFMETIRGLDYAELRAAAGDGGPLAPRFAGPAPGPELLAAAARQEAPRARADGPPPPNPTSPAHEEPFSWSGGSGRPIVGEFRLSKQGHYDRLIAVLQALRATAPPG